MKKIRYTELKDLLYKIYGDEKSKRWKTLKTILQIRRFSPGLKEAFYNFFNSDGEITPDKLSYGGVTFNDLVEHEGMTALQAFLMLDWFDKDFDEAMEYMDRYRFRSPMLLDGEDVSSFRNILDKHNYQPPVDPEENDTSDIVVDK